MQNAKEIRLKVELHTLEEEGASDTRGRQGEGVCSLEKTGETLGW